MDPAPPANNPRFTAIASSAEAVDPRIERDSGDNGGGGRTRATSGRVVLTAAGDLPYKVILTYGGAASSEHCVASMREAEAFIRRNTPVPAARSTLYDRSAAQNEQRPGVLSC